MKTALRTVVAAFVTVFAMQSLGAPKYLQADSLSSANPPWCNSAKCMDAFTCEYGEDVHCCVTVDGICNYTDCSKALQDPCP